MNKRSYESTHDENGADDTTLSWRVPKISQKIINQRPQTRIRPVEKAKTNGDPNEIRIAQ